MSDELRTYTKADLVDFYTDVLLAIDHPEEHTWFSPRRGLCGQLDAWAEAHGIRPAVSDKLYLLQLRLFEDAGLNYSYPFNNGDHAAYAIERKQDDRYTNPARLDWVKRGAANDL